MATPNDFGRMGAAPSHPELLDWLAATFRDSGGSLKQLHRLIVTSAVYRQETRDDPSIRGRRRRRPAALAAATAAGSTPNRSTTRSSAVAGRLDTTMGGPSVQQFALSPGVHVTPVVDYTRYDWNSPGASRRSVYRFLFRTLPDPFFDALDAADASQLTAVRNESTTPLQALALLNNPFVLRQCEHFARRLETLAPDLPARITGRIRAGLWPSARRPKRSPCSPTTPARYGLANLCRICSSIAMNSCS